MNLFKRKQSDKEHKDDHVSIFLKTMNEHGYNIKGTDLIDTSIEKTFMAMAERISHLETELSKKKDKI